MKSAIWALVVAGLLLGMPGKMLMGQAVAAQVHATAARPACAAACNDLSSGGNAGGHGGQVMSSFCPASGGCGTLAAPSAGISIALIVDLKTLSIIPSNHIRGRLLVGPEPRPPDLELLA